MAEEAPVRLQKQGQIDTIWATDVDGVLTVTDSASYAATPTADVEMRAIVESMTSEEVEGRATGTTRPL
jgi:hypothetical protein